MQPPPRRVAASSTVGYSLTHRVGEVVLHVADAPALVPLVKETLAVARRAAVVDLVGTAVDGQVSHRRLAMTSIAIVSIAIASIAIVSIAMAV